MITFPLGDPLSLSLSLFMAGSILRGIPGGRRRKSDNAVARLVEGHKPMIHYEIAQGADVGPELRLRILRDDLLPVFVSCSYASRSCARKSAGGASAFVSMIHEDERDDFVDLLDCLIVEEPIGAVAEISMLRQVTAGAGLLTADDFRHIEQGDAFRLRAAIAAHRGYLPRISWPG